MATLSFESSFLNLRTGVSEIGTGSAAGRLIAAAAENVHAHLIKLLEEGRAAKEDGAGESTPVNAVVWRRASP